ncbi:(d)CMP kinase [Magnetovibrio blakemorei]|uniref:Cytidylate kinase n=1 Tax=Magnetovibrio blakemorei TaxID=28181 RepID=A0A1E5QCD4_9PROT|nr:(d)CMP kinase [Magnetovibrio blakemorei]OEJ69343.1 cytidylate kinase [Magnetovibrio blakemorei]
MSIVIAIDGPAAAGKGTLGLRLEQHFKLAKLDTGLLYRATGFKVLSQGGDPEDPAQAEAAARALDPAELNNPELRTDESAQAASKVSAIPGVRAALLDFQRNFAQNPPKLADGSAAQGAILDGRDIGTTVCPDAEVKLFVTASTEIRAKRRFKELRDRGLEAIYARVLDDMKERDARDTSRSASPLVAAADALQLDTSDMDADQAFAAALDFIAAKNLF